VNLTVSCFSKIQIGFTFLVLAYPGSPGKGPLNGCVCVCVYIYLVSSVAATLAEVISVGLVTTSSDNFARMSSR